MKTFENILEYVEDEYFGRQAAKLLQEDYEVIDFSQANKRVLQTKKSKRVVKPLYSARLDKDGVIFQV